MEYQIVTERLKIQEQTLFSLLCNAMELPTYTYTYLIHYRRYFVLTKNEERVEWLRFAVSNCWAGQIIYPMY